MHPIFILKRSVKWTNIILFGFAFLNMMVLSLSSPLYSFNNGVDPNTMFTVGRGLLSGLMPYKDLFEQKGPLVFLLHTVAALISKTNFIGIYFLESLALGFSMLGIRRILANYLNLWSATFF